MRANFECGLSCGCSSASVAYTPLPSPPCRIILNPIKGQLFVYVLSFKLSSNVDNNPVGRKTVPCMHLWLQTVAAKSTRTHRHTQREIACLVYVGTIICSITYAVESYEPIISVVNTNIHNPYQGPCPLCPRLSSSDEVLCTRTHVRVIVCQCPQPSWEYSPAMSILISWHSCRSLLIPFLRFCFVFLLVFCVSCPCACCVWIPLFKLLSGSSLDLGAKFLCVLHIETVKILWRLKTFKFSKVFSSFSAIVGHILI